ncbi:MAG: hydroxymethylbilane synthase [Pseudonocardiaceae bacterium]
MPRLIKIGTRASPMAVHQAEQVSTDLHAHDPDLSVELVKITTSGDMWLGDLSKLGGKGAFVRDIDRALLDEEIDLAVHCLKDIPGDVPPPSGTTFAAYLAREDIRDAALTRTGERLADLPEGAVVGTSSVRRAAQLRLRFPHLAIAPLRGNANTRLMRLDEGHFDAIVLAMSGLHRLGLTDRVSEVLSVDVMCPPIGAGIIVLQCRTTDSPLRQLASRLTDADATRHAIAERTMLHTLQGHCNSPIAGYASTEPHGALSLRAMVFSLDGSRWHDAHEWGPADDPAALGVSVGAALLRQGARSLIDP